MFYTMESECIPIFNIYTRVGKFALILRRNLLDFSVPKRYKSCNCIVFHPPPGQHFERWQLDVSEVRAWRRRVLKRGREKGVLGEMATCEVILFSTVPVVELRSSHMLDKSSATLRISPSPEAILMHKVCKLTLLMTGYEAMEEGTNYWAMVELDVLCSLAHGLMWSQPGNNRQVPYYHSHFMQKRTETRRSSVICSYLGSAYRSGSSL